MSLRQHCARVLTTDAVGSCDLEYTFQLYVRLPERMVLFDARRDVPRKVALWFMLASRSMRCFLPRTGIGARFLPGVADIGNSIQQPTGPGPMSMEMRWFYVL